MIESRMYARLKIACPHIFIQRFENLIDKGTPDSWISYKDKGIWAELKQLKRLPVTRFKMPWRSGQLSWYKRLRNKSDMPYFIILTLANNWYILNSQLIEMKETYTMQEIEPYFICDDMTLVYHQAVLCRVLGLKD